MITIKHVDLYSRLIEQTIEVKGVLAVLGLHVISEVHPQVTLVVNTSENIIRSIDLILLKEGQDGAALLSNAKYKGSDKGYYLFEKGIRPKPRR